MACSEQPGCSCTYQITTLSSDRHILPATSSCPSLVCTHEGNTRAHARTRQANKPSGAGGCRRCGSLLPPGLFGGAVLSQPANPPDSPASNSRPYVTPQPLPRPALPSHLDFLPGCLKKVLPCSRCFFSSLFRLNVFLF